MHMSLARVCMSWPLILLLGLWAGCDSGMDDPPLVRGRYDATFTYTVEGETYQEPWTLTLDEAGVGEVNGTGLLGVTSVVATGTHTHPELSLTLFDDDGSGQGILTGLVSGDGRRIEATYRFSFFFVDVPVTLERQD
jgi:hypothetical protein